MVLEIGEVINICILPTIVRPLPSQHLGQSFVLLITEKSCNYYQFHLSVKSGLLYSQATTSFSSSGLFHFFFFCLVKRKMTGQYITELIKRRLKY